MNFALGLGHDRSGDRHGNNPSSLKVDDHPNRYMDRKAVIKVPIIYFFDGRSPSGHKQSFFI